MIYVMLRNLFGYKLWVDYVQLKLTKTLKNTIKTKHATLEELVTDFLVKVWFCRTW